MLSTNFKNSSFFRDNLITFSLERNGKIIRDDIKAFFCGKDYPQTIQTFDHYDIHPGDILIESSTKNRYFVDDPHPIGNSSHGLMIRYKTESQMAENKGSINFSGNNYGIIGFSVHGNTITQPITFPQYQQIIDKEPLTKEERCLIQKITQDLFHRAENGYPVEKGMLSKIKNILSDHQALLVPLEELLLHYLFNSK